MRCHHQTWCFKKATLTFTFLSFAITACLALDSLAQPTDKPMTAEDYHVSSLPGIDEFEGVVPVMHAGHISIKPEHNGNLFFWHFQRESTTTGKQKTILWLNGGPGCSSMDGALMEIGPFRTSNQKLLVPNSGAWNKDANLLFVDQPIGVGLSTSDKDSYIGELPEVANDMITFLKTYLELFPDHAQHEWYIAGESFAGQYIPYIAQAILQYPSKIVDLKGILIGNGWIDPVSQYLSYVPFAYNTGLVKPGSRVATLIENKQKECFTDLQDLGQNVTVHTAVCETILRLILRELYKETGLQATDPSACVNAYDIRLQDTYGSCGLNWPPDLTTITPYLRRADVLSALNIDISNRNVWRECDRGVASAFDFMSSAPSVTLIPGLIEEGVEILLFNGDKDLICNWEGSQELIKKLTWGGEQAPSSGFLDDEKQEEWYVDGIARGTYQTGRNLTFVKVFNASHMVPFDVPDESLKLVNRFMGIPGYNWEEHGASASQDSDSKEGPEQNTGGKTEEGSNNSDRGNSSVRGFGVVFVSILLFTAAFLYFRHLNKKLVSDATRSNRAHTGRLTDADFGVNEMASNEGGVIEWFKSRWNAVVKGTKGRHSRLTEDEEEGMPLTVLEQPAGRQSSSSESLNSMLEDENIGSEDELERSSNIV